jgi:hypothetical protein
MSEQRTAGFRFSVIDGIAIALCGLGMWGGWDLLQGFVWILPFALGHFFLFCNIFRVRRNYELAWVAVFFANFAAWYLSGQFTWLGVLGVQAPITLLTIGGEMRSPRYHGIFCQRINARLDEYLAGENFQIPSGSRAPRLAWISSTASILRTVASTS